MKRLDLILTGVGGQGIILASDIVGEVAITAGYDFKKTDTIGMAQRGGSVNSNMRIADHVWSPLIKKGEADILLALEKLEAARLASYLQTGGIAIVNRQALPPLAVSLGSERYPGDDEISEILNQRTNRIYFVNGTRLAKELGNIRILNVFMLGCLSTFLPFKVKVWKDCILQRLPERFQQINLTAFDSGREQMQSTCLEEESE